FRDSLPQLRRSLPRRVRSRCRRAPSARECWLTKPHSPPERSPPMKSTTPLRQRMIQDMKVRNLAPLTQTCYVERVARFAKYFGRSPELLGPEEIRGYQVYLVEQKHASWAVLNQTVCALRFLYCVTLGRDWAIQHIPFAKRPRKLPVVLSL